MTKIPIFYNEKQTATKNTSFSPSAGKPAKVLESYKASQIPIEIMDFKPLKRSHIALAHDPQYVAGVMNGTRTNGFGNTLKEVNETLPYTTGSFLHAALYALKTGKVAASLTSGFHHATYHNGGGFCTFNGLMITAQFLFLHGAANKVGILDMDEHSGNGQENIIKHFGLQKQVPHWSLGYSNVRPYNAEKFFETEFAEILQEKFSDVDVLLFQAGADPWVNDPLGGRLTKEQLRLRDQMVFEFCAANNIPVVYNLAGGYADEFQHVLDIHLNTLIEAAKAFGVCDASDLTNIDDGKMIRTLYVPEADHDDEEIDESQKPTPVWEEKAVSSPDNLDSWFLNDEEPTEQEDEQALILKYYINNYTK
jgi:acetoin utilization deacetylase AcuC-like enzyme